MSATKFREKLQTKIWKILSKPLEKFKHKYAPKIFWYNPLFCSFSLQVIFFSELPFYRNYSTLDSHTNTAISHTLAYSSIWRRKPWQGLLWPISLQVSVLFEKIPFRILLDGLFPVFRFSKASFNALKSSFILKLGRHLASQTNWTLPW